MIRNRRRSGGLVGLSAVLAMAFVGVSCRSAPSKEADVVDETIAEINGLAVSVADVKNSIASGRLGGSLDLVLDETLGLTLALHECEVMEGADHCRGAGSLLERAWAFLDRLFPPDRVCRNITDQERATTYDRLSGRRFPKGADPVEPSVSLALDSGICKGRLMQIQREYIKALRAGAKVRIHQTVVDRLRAEGL